VGDAGLLHFLTGKIAQRVDFSFSRAAIANQVVAADFTAGGQLCVSALRREAQA
jgi:hypothetical protein